MAPYHRANYKGQFNGFPEPWLDVEKLFDKTHYWQCDDLYSRLTISEVSGGKQPSERDISVSMELEGKASQQKLDPQGATSQHAGGLCA